MIHVDHGACVQTGEVVLFPFDNYSIPFRNGLQLTLVEASKYDGNPILIPGDAGKPDCKQVWFYGTVIRIDDEFRMWYLGLGDQDNRWRVCYAVSQDGIHWTKPNLGLVKYGGNTDNNLVDLECDDSILACVVLHDPEDHDPARRFKMSYERKVAKVPGGWCCVAYSRNGLVWKNSPNNPVIRYALEQSGLIKFNGCYYVVGQGGGFRRRCLVIHASCDFEHWTEAVALGFRRDNIPPRPMISGAANGEQVHLGAALWNRGNVIIGFYGQWHGPENNDRRFVNMDIGLVVSNDAIHYREPIPDFKIIEGRSQFDSIYTSAAFVPEEIHYGLYHRGKPCLMQSQGFENVGDKTYVWYGFWREGTVHLAMWPRDRFGYYSVMCHGASGYEIFREGQQPATDVKPHFISCPVKLDHAGSLVFVNADGLSENSYLTVEILDERFQKLLGYSEDSCVPITKSGLRQQVVWRNKDCLEKFEHPIRIQVNFEGLRTEDSRVYAVYIRGIVFNKNRSRVF